MAKACTIGTFDGIHLGHQALLRRCRELGEPLVVTFDPHPRKILTGEAPPLIQTLGERVAHLERLGASTVEVLTFSKNLASWSHDRFLEDLHTKSPFGHLVLGKGASLGADRAGTVEVLDRVGMRLGFQVHAVEPIVVDDETVCSSAVRQAIALGQLSSAKAFLGRPFSVSGFVSQGAGRGTRLGFPTANLLVHGRAMPPRGVYAGWARQGGPWLPAVLNYGSAPTFGRAEDILEVHLLEGEHHLVGHELEVIPHLYLRPQQRFESVEELQQQLFADCQQAYDLISGVQTDLPE